MMSDWYESMKAEVLGKSYDIDGYFGSQCWDFACMVMRDYYDGHVIHCGISGYVKDIAAQRNTNGILNFMIDVPLDQYLEPGDICIWGECADCPYSHIAIYDHDNGDNDVYFLGQNQGASYVNIVKISTAGIIAVFRPKKFAKQPAKEEPKPTPTTGWVKTNGYYTYIQDTKPAIGWKQIDGGWYYFDETTGVMSTNWRQMNKRWYYFGADGAMRLGWTYINGKWYFFETANAQGTMVTGWKELNGKWFYLDEADGHRVKGWQKVDDKWYFFDEDGIMIKGATKE